MMRSKSERKRRGRRLAYGLMGLTTLLWGTASAAAALAGADIAPTALALLRNAFALLLFVPLALAERRGGRLRGRAGIATERRAGIATRRGAENATGRGAEIAADREAGGVGSCRAEPNSIYAAAAGLLGYGAMQLFFFRAAQHTQSGHLVLIMSLAPLLLHLATALQRRQPIRPAQAAGHLLALLGLLLTVGGPDPAGGLGAWRVGDLYALLAMASFAGYTLLIGRLAPDYPRARANVIGVCGGSLLLLAAAPFGPPLAAPAAGAAAQWAAIAYLGLLCTGAANWLYQLALARGPAVKLTNLIYLQPLVGIAAGTLLLNEPLSPASVGGTLLCIAGVAIHGKNESSRSRRKEESS